MNTYTNMGRFFRKVQTGYTMVVFFGISLNNKTFGKNWEKKSNESHSEDMGMYCSAFLGTVTEIKKLQWAFQLLSQFSALST